MQQTDKEDENMKKFINQVELVEDQMIQEIGRASCRERVCLYV